MNELGVAGAECSSLKTGGVELGESWLVSDLGRTRSTIGSGSQCSATLSRDFEELPSALLGSNTAAWSGCDFGYDLQGSNIRSDW